MSKNSLSLVLLVSALAVPVGVASASAPPVGPLPAGPLTSVTAPKGTLVAIAVPAKNNGLVWRLARDVDPTVLRQAAEAEVRGSVVIIFRAVARGDAKVVFALTRGERPHAYAAVTHVVHVR
jgi:hypothetical protein